MAASSSYMASTRFSMLSLTAGGHNTRKLKRNTINVFSIRAQQSELKDTIKQKQEEKQEENGGLTQPRPVEKQINVQSKNMGREFGSEWLSSTTRHVRIFAAYIDPDTCAFDQTQTDKLTLLLDPTDEFVWTDQTVHKVYSYFQELVDHYEGADLTEYTLRLIGSDIEHYIRKMLYDGEIQYNMNARVLNFSMGKPRIGFNYNNNYETEIETNQTSSKEKEKET